MKLVPLTRGFFAKVDDADFERVSAFRWYANVWTRKSGGSYVHANNRRIGKMHRFILRATGDQEVDHKDRDTLNNQRSNLRFCTRSQNNANKPATMPNGFRGIVRDGTRWVARISIGNKPKHLGSFGTREEAAKAYDIAAHECHGEFARLNFPELAEVA